MTWNEIVAAVEFSRLTPYGVRQRGRLGYFRFRHPAVPPRAGSWLVAELMTVLASLFGNPDEQFLTDPGSWSGCRLARRA